MLKFEWIDVVDLAGIKAKNGVVLATEKKVTSPLVDEKTLSKVENLSDSVGMVYAGMPADYRVLLRRGGS